MDLGAEVLAPPYCVILVGVLTPFGLTSSPVESPGLDMLQDPLQLHLCEDLRVGSGFKSWVQMSAMG